MIQLLKKAENRDHVDAFKQLVVKIRFQKKPERNRVNMEI